MLVLLFLLCPCGIARAGQALPLPAPQCVSPQNCDRNEQDLKDFVASFYRWYSSDEALHDWGRDVDIPLIKQAISARLFKSFNKTVGKTNVDPIVWAQDRFPSWPDHITIKTIDFHMSQVRFDVQLGLAPDEINHLQITLRPSYGKWMIDEIRDMDKSRH